MTLAPFRHVLALPRVRPLMLLMLLARIPTTAAGVTLTLHVVLTLDRGYGAAGLVGAAITAGMGLGAPAMGRLIDRRGLRTTLVRSVLCESAFWLLSPWLSFEALLVAAFAGGLLCVPVMSIGRQALTALVPAEHRRTTFSMDSISIEISFMAGPALSVLVATRVSTTATLLTLGVAVVASGLLLYVVNPPLVGEGEVVTGERPGKREWVTGSLLAALLTAVGALLVVSGMEVAAVASLEHAGQTHWTGVVFIVICLASATGGMVYGGLPRVPGQAALLALMGLLTLPAGLGGGNWLLLSLTLVPMSLLCAPTLASTCEKITSLVPASVRGEAMGLQGSAFKLGAAVGGPVAGMAIDHSSPAMGFVAVGAAGLAVAALARALSCRRGRAARGRPAPPAGVPARSGARRRHPE